jgi:hypothetical protein
MISKNLCFVLLTALAVSGLASCESSHKSVESNKSASPSASVDVKPTRVAKYYFVFSSSGFSDRPSDAFRVDTNRSMDFETRKKGADGGWHSLKGMAVIEPNDYDTLARLISDGNLLDLDPTDLSTNCPSGEIYTLTIGSTLRPKPTHVDYTACSIDYNLLMKPQRSNFVELAHWFDAMRDKYRPAEEQ